MRLTNTFLVLAFFLAASPVSADPGVTEADARAFFAKYVELGEAFDVALADLYSDGAVIRAERRYPNGENRAVQLTGQQWKALIVKAMPLAKKHEDRSTYSNLKVTVSGDRARIDADRYSERKCYTDSGYYMVIERQPDGTYLIVEEYSKTQPQSSC